ncbi:TonB-dependent receptor [bacterium]|nr:TonB-dependent receptor [bacterium]MBU1599121.1 TonB-dependent receptor [bacterium]
MYIRNNRMRKILVLGLILAAQMVLAQEELLWDVPKAVTPAKYEQLITEAPAVVTVITAEQIKRTGARNLLDILRTVPGFHILADTNEHLTVIHGVFASTNQKFLLLRDGHRLNDFMWYLAVHEYSVSLANIERIEIIRGPGSILYGSAALCGVINIITKDGEGVEGGRLDIGVGNYGQLSLDAVFGKSYDEDSSLLIYGSIDKIDGEKVDQPANRDISGTPTAGWQYVDRYPPNFDLGMRLREGYFTLAGSIRHYEYTPPRANNGGLYEFDGMIKDIEQVFTYGQLDLDYTRPVFEQAELKVRHYLDYEYWNSWQLIAPPRDYPPYGKLLFMDIEGLQVGGEYSLRSPWLKGDLLTGIRIEDWQLLDATYRNNFATFTVIAEGTESLLTKTGGEYYTAIYFETNQALTDKVRLNLGTSYDHYEIAGGSFNPRIGLIWTPKERLTTKFLYGRAFINPSYFYRYITPEVKSYSGPSLKPEVMDTYQVQVLNQFNARITTDLHLFYNILKGYIKPDRPTMTYKNMEKMTVFGVEPEVKLRLRKNLDAFGNYTYTKPIEDETDGFLLKDGTLKNIPVHTANLGIDYQIHKDVGANLLINWHGKIESPIMGSPTTKVDLEHEIPSTTIVDLNLLWQPKSLIGTGFNLKIHNLFDEDDYSGGTPPIDYPQAGRWWLLTITKEF